MNTSPRRRHRAKLAGIIALVVLATTMTACQNGKVGGRCKAGTVAQDSTHVLICKKGRWARLISKADGMRELARIKAEEEAAKRAAETPPATAPPATEPPATAPPATEPPATVPPATEPPATVPPTTAPVVTTPPTTSTSTTTSTVPQSTSTTTSTTSTSTTTSTVPPTTSTTTTTTTLPSAPTTDVDGSFGDDGRFQLELPTQGESVMATATSAGGTTYVMFANPTYGQPPRVRKVLASGDVDPSFGTNGTVPAPATSCYRCDLGVDDEGRLYVWGGEFTATVDIPLRVARYDQDGTPDLTYGTQGVTTMSTTPNGVFDLGPTGWFVAVESWATRTYVVPPTGPVRQGVGLPLCSVYDIAVDESGRSVAGSASCPESQQDRIGRLTNQGTPETTFGTHTNPPFDLPGMATIASLTGTTRALAVDSSGLVYLASDRTVRRLTATGSLDTTYGGGAATLASVPGSDSIISVAMVDDRFYALLATTTFTTQGMVVSKLNPFGVPDATYGDFGVASPTAIATANVISSNGSTRLLRSGSGVMVSASMTVPDARIGSVSVNGLLKLRFDGAPEPAYAEGGLAALRFAPVSTFLQNTFPGPSGSVYLHLWISPAGPNVLVRVTSGGQLDTSFSGDGWLTDPASDAITVDTAGRPLVYRTTSAPSGSMSFGNPAYPVERTLTRYTHAGVPDTTFHPGDGTVTWPVATYPAGAMGTCDATLTSLTDGSTVMSYLSQGPTATCSSTGFDKVSAGGVLTSAWGSGYAAVAGTQRTASLVVPGPNDTTVVLARPASGTGLSARVVRLNVNGSADQSFGAGGGFDVAVAGTVIGQIHSLDDGSVIVTSSTAISVSYPNSASWIRRYLPSGQPVIDTGAFDHDGMAVVPVVQHLTTTGDRLVGAGWDAIGLLSVLRPDATFDTSYPGPADDGRAAFGAGDLRNVFPTVSAGRAYAVTSMPGGTTVEIYKLGGTIG